MNRNRYFLLGVLLILLGVQFRMVDSFVLNEQATRALARMHQKTKVASRGDSFNAFLMEVHPRPTKRIQPPRWMSLAMIAGGAVLSLHALAMPRHE